MTVMEMTSTTADTRLDWGAMIHELGPRFASRSAEHDANDRFVADNYAELKEKKFFSAGVPLELGGGGLSHRELGLTLRTIARYCASTALATSMHTHLVGAQVWNFLHGKSAPVLEQVAARQLVLVSTGAKDWLDSNGTATRVDGGFLINAKKFFASGSPAGNVLVTSAQHDDPDLGPQVLHFPVPMSAPGVRIDQNWIAHGMRGTGSNTVVLEDVFVPDGTIALRRPRGPYHPVFNVIVTVALPLITSVYLGVAEAAAAIAREQARNKREDAVTQLQLGEMENLLTTATMAVESAFDLANNYDFDPQVDIANAVLQRKTIAAKAVIGLTQKALEITGGGGFFRGMGLERLIRDAQASYFHPLPEKQQQLFSGRVALGLDPI